MIKNINFYKKKYTQEINNCLESLNEKKLNDAYKIILKKILNKRKIFFCGNGGSAAISNHAVCDYMKGLSDIKNINPKIISLSSNVPIITAISNDLSYADVYLKQFENLYETNDLLVLISSSGRSANILKLLNFAKKKKVKVIGLSGFSRNVLDKKSDISLHVKSKNYGIVEDCHQIILHTIYQAIKINLSKKQINKIRL